MNIQQQRTFRWMVASLVMAIGCWFAFNTNNTVVQPNYIFPGVENANVQRLDIRSNSTTVSLIRAQGQWNLDGKHTIEAEYAAVEGMLTKLLHATRSEPLAVTDGTPFGLQPVQVSLTLTEEDNTTHTLDIGNPLQVSTDSYIRLESHIYTTAGRLAEDWNRFKTHLQGTSGEQTARH